MYNLPYHKEHDEQTIIEFVKQHPFAFLSGCDAQSKPVATQVPLFMEERNRKYLLWGHLMKNTDHHKAFIHNPNVLAVFASKHAYVSGTWYSNPHTPSTWNYMSVHASGIIRFLDGDELEKVLRLTSLHFEGNNSQSPTAYNNLPKNLLKKLMGAIVAFEIEVTKMDTVFKLSQDRDEESYHNIIAKLKEQDEDGRFIAGEMEKRAKILFPKKQ